MATRVSPEKTTDAARVVLAPLAEVTDGAFRAMAFACGADAATTEMVSAAGLVRGSRNTPPLLERLPEPVGKTRQECVQFLADAYAAALEAVVRQYPDQWYNFYDFWK